MLCRRFFKALWWIGTEGEWEKESQGILWYRHDDDDQNQNPKLFFKTGLKVYLDYFFRIKKIKQKKKKQQQKTKTKQKAEGMTL